MSTFYGENKRWDLYRTWLCKTETLSPFMTLHESLENFFLEEIDEFEISVVSKWVSINLCRQIKQLISKTGITLVKCAILQIRIL